MKTASVTITGTTPLLMHADNIDWADKMEAWKNNPAIKIYGYPAGTWGPEPSNSLIEGEGLEWRYPCKNMADEELYCEL